MQDLLVDAFVEKLKGIEIAFVDGPPKQGGETPLKVRAAFIPHSNNSELRGSFVISPGRTEYVEKYAETILELVNRGFNCVIIDHRGQGLSDRIGSEYWLGDIDSFTKSAEHLRAAIDYFDNKLPQPRYMISHSMGGLIVIDGLIRGIFNDIRGAIFNAPMWSLAPARFAKALVLSLCASGLRGRTAPTFKVKWQPGDFYTNDVSSDKVRYARNNALMLKEPRLQLGGPTNAWFNAAFNVIDELTKENLSKINIPILVLQAGMEELVDNAGQTRVATALPNAVMRAFPNAKHEMLVEREEIRNQVWQTIDNFLNFVEAQKSE